MKFKNIPFILTVSLGCSTVLATEYNTKTLNALGNTRQGEQGQSFANTMGALRRQTQSLGRLHNLAEPSKSSRQVVVLSDLRESAYPASLPNTPNLSPEEEAKAVDLYRQNTARLEAYQPTTKLQDRLRLLSDKPVQEEVVNPKGPFWGQYPEDVEESKPKSKAKKPHESKPNKPSDNAKSEPTSKPNKPSDNAKLEPTSKPNKPSDNAKSEKKHDNKGSAQQNSPSPIPLRRNKKPQADQPNLEQVLLLDKTPELAKEKSKEVPTKSPQPLKKAPSLRPNIFEKTELMRPNLRKKAKAKPIHRNRQDAGSNDSSPIEALAL